ncbi:hypothetical protein Tco_1419381 [Tanacetum coccineum]
MLVKKPLPSPKAIKIQELTNQVLILQSQKVKLEKAHAAAKVEAALFKAQPSYPNVEKLTELPRYVEGLEIKIPGDLKEIPEKLEEFQSYVSGLTKQVAELKNLKLDLLAGLLALPKQVSCINDKLSKLKVHVFLKIDFHFGSVFIEN